MAQGPGKYDDVCTEARIATNAAATLLVVLAGDKGSGFSVQTGFPETTNMILPGILRDVATQIENDLEGVTDDDS